MADREYVAESSSDTPEQIASALGAELEAAVVTDPVAKPAEAVVEPEVPAAAAATDDAAVVEEPAGEDEPVEEPAAEATTERDPATGKFKPKKPVQPRIDKLTKDKHEAIGRAAALEAENAGLKKRLEELAASKPAEPKPAAPVAVDLAATEQKKFDDERAALGAKPKQEDFEDFAVFEDKRDAWVEARASINAAERFARERAAERADGIAQDATRAFNKAATTYQGRVEAARLKHADFDAVIASATDITPTPQLQMLLLDEGFEAAGEMAYYLAKHKAEAARILALPPGPQLVELGAVKAIVQGQVAVATARPTPKPTQAPDPVTTHVAGEAPSTSATDSADDSKLPYQEYKRRKNAQEFRSRRAS